MADTTYVIEVKLIGGPVTRTFRKRNRSVRRTLELLGTHTLDRLHEEIFEAFDRYDEHLYEFRFGKTLCDRDARRHEGYKDGGLPSQEVGDARKTSLDKLRLRPGQTFWYWFDFGDDWWHQVKVKSIGEAQADEVYPRLVASVGDSPPQYPDWEDEECGDDDEAGDVS